MRGITLKAPRGLLVLVAAIGLIVGLTASPAAAQNNFLCVDPASSGADTLAGFDFTISRAIGGSPDGVLTAAELTTYRDTLDPEDDAETIEGLNEILGIMSTNNVAGLQYEDCTPSTTQPTQVPTQVPTEVPGTEAPTDVPGTEAPTDVPGTEAPTEVPGTEVPGEPTDAPTQDPGEGDDDGDDGEGTVDELPDTGQGPNNEQGQAILFALLGGTALFFSGAVLVRKRFNR
jgi:hypothetical protein